MRTVSASNHIKHLSRLEILRGFVRVNGIKHSALAHAAGINSGHFSHLWNGKRPLNDAVWPRMLAAITLLSPVNRNEST